MKIDKKKYKICARDYFIERNHTLKYSELVEMRELKKDIREIVHRHLPVAIEKKFESEYEFNNWVAEELSKYLPPLVDYSKVKIKPMEELRAAFFKQTGEDKRIYNDMLKEPSYIAKLNEMKDNEIWFRSWIWGELVW